MSRESEKIYLRTQPRIVESEILSLIPKDIMIKIIEENEKENYLMLKLTPETNRKGVYDFVTDIENKFNLETTLSLAPNGSAILEIYTPLFDILVMRDTTNIMDGELGYYLNVVYNGYIETKTIAQLKYDEDSPFTLKIAEHLVEYLNQNSDKFSEIDFEPIMII